MKIKLLTANDTNKILNFITLNENDFYIDYSFKTGFTENTPFFRDFIFQGLYICVAALNENKIEKLLIIDNNMIRNYNSLSSKVYYASFDIDFIKKAIDTIHDLIDTEKKLQKIYLNYQEKDFNMTSALVELGFYKNYDFIINGMKHIEMMMSV